MDGGGRDLQPMTAGPAGGAAQRATAAKFWNARPAGRWPRLRWSAARRRSVTAPLERHLPRALGTWLMSGFLGLVTIVGLVQGGHWQEMCERYGAPHHLLARIV